MTSRPRVDNYSQTGDSMNELNPAESQTAIGRVDLARTDADRVATLVQIAREGHNEARDHGEGVERLQNAFDVLFKHIASKPGDRNTRLDRALYGVDGSLDRVALLEYVDFTGREGMTARQALQRILDRRTLPELEGGLEISDRLHGLAHSWEREDRVHEAPAPAARPALPPAVSDPQQKSAQALPQRGPQPQEPMFPPAPPESPVEQTGTLVALVKDASAAGALSGRSVQRLHDEGFGQRPAAAAPVFGPPVDPKFVASALPGRIGDTVTMRTEDVLAHLDADDASKDDTEAPERRPFVRAASAAESRSSGAAGKGAGDESGS